jgi:FtsZ-binding cell division protein ZapB
MKVENLELIEKNQMLVKENSEQKNQFNSTIAQYDELVIKSQNQSAKISELQLETNQLKEQTSKLTKENQDLEKNRQELTTWNHNCRLEKLELSSKTRDLENQLKEEVPKKVQENQDLKKLNEELTSRNQNCSIEFAEMKSKEENLTVIQKINKTISKHVGIGLLTIILLNFLCWIILIIFRTKRNVEVNLIELENK